MQRLLIICLLPLHLIAQNSIGLPDVINYPKQMYRAGLQSWDITQDQNNILFFANNEGLLSFDGKYWKLYPLPNKTIVRSVKAGGEGMIFVGGQDELGYFSPDRNGRLVYHSLLDLVPEKDRSFGDVWDISLHQGSVFFRTPGRIFKLAGRNLSVFTAPGEWSFMEVCNRRLFAHDYERGLLLFENDIWMPVAKSNPLPGDDPVTSLVPVGKDSILVTLLKSGVYLLQDNTLSGFSSAAISRIASERIYAACAITENRVALATSKGGVHIIDASGNAVQHFSRSEGLQNNNVLSIFPDKQQNLWLGLDNGIDFIAYNSAVKRVVPHTDEGAGYTAILFDNKLYTGTSGGLLQVPVEKTEDLSFSRGSFSPVTNTTGQTWTLAAINNQLLLGHHDGAFLVKNNGAEKLSLSYGGVWNFIPLSQVFPASRILTGHYKGLAILDYNEERFIPAGAVPDFKESSRFVVPDKDNSIWVSHPYHGVTRIREKANGGYDIRLYTDKQGLPSALNNHIYKIKNELLVATEKGVFLYEAATDRFEPGPLYRRLLGDQSLRYLKEDTEGNIWFIRDKTLGVLDMSGKDTAIIYLPELNNKLLSGFEFIYPLNSHNVFVGSEKGFFHINYDKYKRTAAPLQMLIRSVRSGSKKDSLLFGGYSTGADASRDFVPRIPHNQRFLLFEYASPMYGQQANLEYSTRLKGLDNNWSEWSDKTEKEFTHLPAGSYVFEVKVRNNLGNESEVARFSFVILPPWYQTRWAYLAYALLTGIGLYRLYKWQRKKFLQQQRQFEEEQRRQSYLYQLEMDKAANELVTLRNEKLQAEIDFKNAELAQSAMHLVQKGELLSRIRSELNHLMKSLDNEKSVTEIKKMIRVLGEDDKMDKDWEHFAQHFDKVHSDFVKVLKEKHPTLSPNEVKLCAYLRMNLSSKEIAQLMNISVRGVEISRYRLRKKLGIATETTLFDYLIAVQPASPAGPNKED